MLNKGIAAARYQKCCIYNGFAAFIQNMQKNFSEKNNSKKSALKNVKCRFFQRYKYCVKTLIFQGKLAFSKFCIISCQETFRVKSSRFRHFRHFEKRVPIL